MNKTKIEWTDYTWNPVTGCLHGCPYCYARKIALRFPKAFPKGFNPTLRPDRLGEPHFIKKPSRIFTVSMGDLFGNWVPELWQRVILETITHCPQHTFQILTKAPENIHQHIDRWPGNVWIGISLTGTEHPDEAIRKIRLVKEHRGIRFISFEPLLGSPQVLHTDLRGINWVIVGAQTNPFKAPDVKWIQRVENMARFNRCALFIKNNAKYNGSQDFPQVGPGSVC